MDWTGFGPLTLVPLRAKAAEEVVDEHRQLVLEAEAKRVRAEERLARAMSKAAEAASREEEATAVLEEGG